MRVSKGVIPAVQDSYWHLILKLILKYKNIFKMNLYLLVFIQEIIYLK